MKKVEEKRWYVDGFNIFPEADAGDWMLVRLLLLAQHCDYRRSATSLDFAMTTHRMAIRLGLKQFNEMVDVIKKERGYV